MRSIIASTLLLTAFATKVDAQELRMQGTIQLESRSGNIFSGNTDSLSKRWKVDTSGTVFPWEKYFGRGEFKGRSEPDGFIKNGQKFYIRNFKPDIDPKPVVPGSLIYPCE